MDRIPRPAALVTRKTATTVTVQIGPIVEGGKQDVRLSMTCPANRGAIAADLTRLGLVAYKDIPFKQDHIPLPPVGAAWYMSVNYATPVSAFMLGECRCEAHPDRPFPHGDCAGPGTPWGSV